jgi:hypothetical protein
MTDTPGATDLLGTAAPSPAPAPAPAWQPAGMPVTPAGFDEPAAVAARSEIKAKIGDKEFYQALKAERERGASGPASTEWAALHRTGWPAAPEVRSQADVDAQANARLEDQWNSYFAALQARFSLTEQNRAELRAGVIREDLRRFALDEKDRLIKDKSFRTRLLDGERAANQQWGMITSMLSLRPVKQQ